MKRILAAACILGWAPCGQAAEPPAPPHSAEREIVILPMPVILANHRLPPPPADPAAPEDVVSFLRAGDQKLKALLKGKLVFGEDALLAVDPVSESFVIRADSATVARLVEWTSEEGKPLPRQITLTLTGLDVPETAIQGLLESAAATKGSQETILQNLRNRPGIREIIHLQGQGKDGVKTRVSKGSTQDFRVAAGWDKDGAPVLEARKAFVGTKLAFTPTLKRQNALTPAPGLPESKLSWSLVVRHAITHRPAAAIWNESVPLLDGRSVAMPVAEFPLAEISGALEFMNGDTLLVAVLTPAGKDTTRAQALFLAATVEGPPPAGDPARLLRWVERYGHEAAPTQDGAKGVPSPPAMVVRKIPVPPNWTPPPSPPNQSADPFGGVADESKGAECFLRHLGVPFPEGARAEFDPATSRLTVRSTPEALVRIEEVLSSIGTCATANQLASAILVEGPADLVGHVASEADRSGNHEAAWKALSQEIEQGRARQLSRASVLLSSAQPARIGAWIDSTPTSLRCGWELVIDSSISADGKWTDVDLDFKHDQPSASTGPGPVPRFDFQTMISIPSARMRMVAVAPSPAPEGRDTLQVLFFQTTPSSPSR